jgi:hypothetical protein
MQLLEGVKGGIDFEESVALGATLEEGRKP